MKHLKLSILLAFLLCNCAGLPAEEHATEVTGEGQTSEAQSTEKTAPATAESAETLKPTGTTDSTVTSNAELNEFRIRRQKEMQQQMQQKMMRGGTQTNRPVSIGPP